jgi:hypothetical protein
MTVVTSTVNDVLGHLFGDDTFSLPANYYIGLSTTTPTETGTNITEPVGNGYARVTVPNNSTYWNTASARAVTNKLDIDFAESTGSWGTITYFVIFDSLSGGTAMYFDSVSSRVVYDTTVVSFPAETVTITIPSS